jgi:5-methylcytosine-specific restriction endonuclease McrA
MGKHFKPDGRYRFGARSKQDAARSWWAIARPQVCHYCGKAVHVGDGPEHLRRTIDHATPICRGGEDEPANWRLACAGCNSDKADLTEAQYAEKKSRKL